jgi:hypothetical protein
VLNEVNSKRFVGGADNRLMGAKLSKIESLHIVLFTANPQVGGVKEMMSLK